MRSSYSRRAVPSTTMRTVAVLCIVSCLTVGCSATSAPVQAFDSSAIALSTIDGTTTPVSFVLAVDIPGATSARLVLDDTYVGMDESRPLQFDVSVDPGPHVLKVRTSGGEGQRSVEASFDASPAPRPAAVPTTASP